MTRLLVVVGALGLFLSALPVQACHRCCPAPCCPQVCCDIGPCGTVTYVDKVITCYRTEWKPRTVTRTVKKMVTREVEEKVTYYENLPIVTPVKQTVTKCVPVLKQVPYTYDVCVPVYTPQKQIVTRCVPVAKQVPYTYNVCVPVYTPQKQIVTKCVPVTRQVPYTYNVCVPVYTPQKRIVTTYQCVPEKVTKQVPVCRMVATQVFDPCTCCCRTVCCPVTEMQTVTCTVMKTVAVPQEVTVTVCSYKMEQRQGVKMVCELVPSPRK